MAISRQRSASPHCATAKAAAFLGAALLASCSTASEPGTVAIVHATVIDGTGSPPRADWTLLIRTGLIEQTDVALYLAHGVTSVRDMGCDPECTATLVRWRGEIDSGARRGLRLLVAGPNVDGPKPLQYAGHVNVAEDTAAAAVADLVVLDADPLEDIRNTRRIVGVMPVGEYLDRSALDAALLWAQELGAFARTQGKPVLSAR